MTMQYEQKLCPKGVNPWETVKWKKVDVSITDFNTGNVIFEQKQVEAPEFWSDQAITITASKYFCYNPQAKARETSVWQLIHRVMQTLSDWGVKQNLFDKASALAFYNDLCYIHLHQYAAFNSPVWFNIGQYHVYGKTANSDKQEVWAHQPSAGKALPADGLLRPQGSACFIYGLKDDIESIWQYCSDSARLFKYGSGVGADWSALRSTYDFLSGGGKPSGPVSFIKVQDSTGGAIKSGGRTRRSAIMVTLKDQHPDIMEFIDAKKLEERKALTLVKAGYTSDFNGEAYQTVAFQNMNFSVRLSNSFFKCYENDEDWQTKRVELAHGESEPPKYKAKELLRRIAQGTWECGDPGVQYEDEIQAWNTVPELGRINSSNPCSEFMFLDDTACNLASLNLMKFAGNSVADFNVQAYNNVVRTMIFAMDLIVDGCGYPTQKIADNSHKLRPLGLGYANLGAFLMVNGIPYDSDEGRTVAGALAALLSGFGYLASLDLADVLDSFIGYSKCENSTVRVMQQHRAAAYKLDNGSIMTSFLTCEARRAWDELVTCLTAAESPGLRNSQISVIAPTGTIAFMMDCATTGIEPELALVKYKNLAGGGHMRIVNPCVGKALGSLNFSTEKILKVLEYVEQRGVVEGCNLVQESFLPVFDTSFRVEGYTRSINWQAHVKMLAAVQPFISGSISKTINMPKESTVEDIEQAYLLGYKLKLKAMAIYRDGSKGSQALTTEDPNQETTPPETEFSPRRSRLPKTRQGLVHKFSIDGHEGYIIPGLYKTGELGEVFIVMDKEGSTIGGLMSVIGKLTSAALQHGVPLKTLIDLIAWTKFEPCGMTDSKDLPIARSIPDFIFRWLGMLFDVPGYKKEDHTQKPTLDHALWVRNGCPPCAYCGQITIRAGACYACTQCGQTSGCG